MDVDGDVLVSTDGGLTFNGTTDYVDVTLGRISGIAADPHDAATAYVLFSFAERPKILKTTDYGATWDDISGFDTGAVSTNGFPDVAIYDLMVFPNDPDHIWVGSEIGLIESLDGGATWGLADDGLPAVGIWKLAAIEDEVVLATHGRGIWTVSDVSLMDGTTYKPLFEQAAQAPSSDLYLEFNLRSEYDSTQVWVDGAVVTTYGPNTVFQNESLNLPVLVAGTRTIFARAYKDLATYDSVTRNVDVLVYETPVTDYTNLVNNDSDGDAFQRDGINWRLPSGFSNGAMHTDHNYPSNANATATLLTPITLSGVTTLTFDEVVIVEPGEPGSVYGDSDFWDYVIVEGTADGVNWLPLVDGYDARADTDWLNAYYAGSPGDASLYRDRTIDLNATFAEGETILLRFRLFSDGYVEGWGWAFDNIVVEGSAISAANDLPVALVLDQNHPNPFNPLTTISFSLPRDDKVRLKIFDVRGQLVRTLADGPQTAGSHSVVWNGRDDRGAEVASGTYLYRLETSESTVGRKMLLLK
jgi:hypothetical protein